MIFLPLNSHIKTICTIHSQLKLTDSWLKVRSGTRQVAPHRKWTKGTDNSPSCLWQVSKLTDEQNATKLQIAIPVASGSFEETAKQGVLTVRKMTQRGATFKLRLWTRMRMRMRMMLGMWLLDFNLNFNRMPNRQT